MWPFRRNTARQDAETRRWEADKRRVPPRHGGGQEIVSKAMIPPRPTTPPPPPPPPAGYPDPGETTSARARRLTAERDRYREHSIALNTIAWRIASALGDVPAGADRITGDPVEQADRLIAELEHIRTGLTVLARDVHADARQYADNVALHAIANRIHALLDNRPPTEGTTP